MKSITKMKTTALLVFLLILPYAIGDLKPCTNGKDGWFLFDIFCYKFMDEPKSPRTWAEAEAQCQSQKSHLASVTSRDESDYLKTVLDSAELITSPSSWIGLRADSVNSNFKWSDDTAFDYTNWNGGDTPIPDSRTSCVVLTIAGKWGATDCSVKLKSYICKKYNSTMEPPTEPPEIQGNCPEDWFKFRNKCYRPFSTRAEDGNGLNFEEAQKVCIQNKANLASIPSEAEQEFLTSRMGELDTNAWIGLKSTSRWGSHTWLDKSIETYTNWAPGEPTINNENCVEMYVTPNVAGKWNDVPCDKKLGYICKKNSDPNLPLPKPVTSKYCPYGYNSRYRNSCFKLEKSQKLGWNEAQKQCKYSGNSLTSINDRFDQAYLNTFLETSNFTEDVWIGFSDTDPKKPGLFSWSSGWPTYFTHWDKDEPQPEPNGARCVYFKADTKRWVVTNCTDNLAFICRYNDDKTPDIPVVTGKCPESAKANWIDVGNNYCYHVDYRTKSNWGDATKACGLLGGNAKLASMHSQHDLDLLRPIVIDNENSNLWIGLVQDESGGYIWSDGTASEFIPWDEGEPTRGTWEPCVELLAHKMKYNNIGCGSRRNFICEAEKIPGPPPPPTTPPPRTHCGDLYSNWRYFNDSCYLIQPSWSDTNSWHDASDFCNKNGGHLVSIHSEEENNFLFQAITYVGSSYWIGLSASMDDAFEWSDDTILDFDALAGGTESLRKNERCAQVTRVYQQNINIWKLAQCNNRQPGICKRPFGVTPSTVTPKPTTAMPGYCEGGWTRTGNKCVKLFGSKENERKNFTTALEDCESKGTRGSLMSIQNEQEQSVAISLMLDTDENVWIGLKKQAYGSYFFWTDSSRYNYQNWAAGQPANTYYTVICGMMQIGRSQAGKWKTSMCTESISYICETLPSITAVTTPVSEPDCWTKESGYVKYGNSCFKMYGGDNNKTWQDAEDDCKSKGGHLASVNSALEQSFINIQLFSTTNKTDSYWIGLKDDKTKRFVWADQWPVYYTNWGYPHPLSSSGSRCAFIDTGAKVWNSTDCTDVRNYICEISKDKPPVVPDTKGMVCPDHAKGSLWQDLGNDYCYYIQPASQYYERKNWGDASFNCIQMNSELASIHSQHELDILSPHLKGATQPLWLGLIMKHNGEFEWHDKTPFDFGAWELGEPSKFNNPQCGSIDAGSNKWKAIACTTPQGFVCRIEKVNDDGTTIIPIDDTTIANNKTITDEIKSGDDSKMGGGAVAGIVIFVILAVFASIGAAYYYLKRRNMLPNFSRGTGVGFDNNLYEGDNKS